MLFYRINLRLTLYQIKDLSKKKEKKIRELTCDLSFILKITLRFTLNSLKFAL